MARAFSPQHLDGWHPHRVPPPSSQRASHSARSMQEQLHNENGAQHLSQSHLYCWRTLAVTLELFPSMYRKCMFQLALVPAGTLMSQQLLTVRRRASPVPLSSCRPLSVPAHR